MDMIQTFYIDDECFVLDGMQYESENGRYYTLEASKCLRSDCGGKMVRRRTSKSFYEYALNKVKEAVKC
jgi:hypothetical protein